MQTHPDFLSEDKVFFGLAICKPGINLAGFLQQILHIIVTADAAKFAIAAAFCITPQQEAVEGG